MKYVDYEEIDKGHKVLDVCEFDKPIYYEYGEGYYNLYDDEEFEEIIKKHSKNIIDLIEVGDYVNGSKLISIDYAEDEFGNCDKLHFYYQFEDSEKDINEYYDKLVIKSIVTKEAFANAEYRVEIN